MTDTPETDNKADDAHNAKLSHEEGGKELQYNNSMTNTQQHCAPVKLKLVGLDGNAFFLMGAFQREARKQGRTSEEIKAVMDALLK